MPLGTKEGFGPGHIVLHGDPAPISEGASFVRSFFAGRSPAYSGLQRVGRQQASASQTGHSPHFLTRVYCGQTVAHLSYC